MLAPALALLCFVNEPPSDPAQPVVEDPQPIGEESQPVVEDPQQLVDARPRTGGFGTIESFTTTSDVVALPLPPTASEQHEGPAGPEMSLLIEAGYTQTNLGNRERLDHQGLALRAHFVYYPWISRSRVIGGGLGLLYGYQGLNRRQGLPEGTPASKAQQQQIMISVDMLLRPHPQWFTMLVSGGIGLGFYTNAKLFAGDRRATIAKQEYAFVAGASLGLCTAWSIVCVLGGAHTLLGVMTQPVDTELGQPLAVDPWGWQVTLGVDVLRIMARANRTPS